MELIDTKARVATALAAMIAADQAAKVPPSDDGNPLGGHTLADIVHGKGVSTPADHYPAVNPATSGSHVALEQEYIRRVGLEEGKKDRSAKRMAVARQRAEVKKQLDTIAKSDVKPSPERLEQAWDIVAPMSEIVRRIANSKQRWAARFLGSTTDDVGIMAIEQMVLVLARIDRTPAELTVLRQAAWQLSGQLVDNVIPGDQVPIVITDPITKAERKQRKRLAKARKWLMGMANNRVMGALADLYTISYNLRWENLDLITTVMASISGIGEDPMFARTKADRAPAMPVRSRRPGVIDPQIVVHAIAAAITDRRLDRLAELLLDQDRINAKGAFMWSRCAEAVFLASPHMGEWRWDMVCKATEHLAKPRKARGYAAQLFVRQQFAWLPSVIAGVHSAYAEEGYLPSVTQARVALRESLTS